MKHREKLDQPWMFNFRNALLFYFPPPILQECRHIHCSVLIQKKKEKNLWTAKWNSQEKLFFYRRNYFWHPSCFCVGTKMVWLMKTLPKWKRGSVWNSKFQLSLHPCGEHRVLHTIVTVRLKRNVSSVQKFAMITSRGQKDLTVGKCGWP